MCGIGGFYSRNEIGSHTLLSAMGDTLSHRGPDAEGSFHEAGFGLIHRRLSIIDPGEASNQPMISSNGRYVIVFNGEIYNFKEVALKHDLLLKTGSDTEVFLESFSKRGISILDEFNGMFAAGILDRVEKKLYLIRDRIGKKPIYYYADDSTFIFGSELKAIVKSGVKLTINRDAIHHFLHLGFIPTPLSIYNEIHKLEQGAYLEVSGNSVKKTIWYNLSEKYSRINTSTEEEALEDLNKLVRSSVSYRLIADVPFGSFLSGGVDSGLVTAVAASVANEKLKTFSIGFNNSAYDESFSAKEVASFLGTDHQQFIVSEEDALNELETIIDHFDEPFADSSALPVHLVSKMASKEVKMVLSGDGGDELFMGYGAYNWANRLSNPFIKTAGRIAYPLITVYGSNRVKRVSRMFNNDQPIESLIFSQEQYLFAQQELKGLLKSQYAAAKYQLPGYARARVLSAREKQQFFDITTYLHDDLMVKTDRSSMFNSIEVRCPLLDYRLMEFALNLPENFKIRDGVQKYLLKKLLFKYLPQELYNRPKRGFSIPLKDWLRKDLRYLLQENLSAAKLEEIGVFNPDEVLKLRAAFENGQDYLYNRLWVIAVLQRWLLKNNYASRP